MDKKIIRDRLSDLKSLMKSEGIDYYLVFTSDYHQSEYVDEYFKTREYISGFTGSAGYILISEAKSILWVDGRYYVQAANEIESTGIEMYKLGLEDTKTLIEYLKENVTKDQVVATDGRTVSASFYEELKDSINNAKLITEIDLFETLWTDRPKLSKKSIIELPIEVSGKSRKDKLDYFRKKMAEYDIDGYFIADLSSIMWLFNIRGFDVECNPVAFSYAYITNNDVKLFIQDGTVSNEIKESLIKDNIVLEDYNDVICFIKNEITNLRIGIDYNEINAGLYSLICAKNTAIKVNNYEFIPKQIKNETEITLAKKYHEEDAVAMIRFIMYIKEAVKNQNITETDAANYLDSLRSKIDGFMGLSFDTISGYGSNGAIVHYSPQKETAAKLKPEGFLLVDSGGQYMGATTDITRTIVLGPISNEQKKHFTAVLKAVISLASIKFMEGINGSHLDILARGPIWNLGIDYRHGTGHGIGAFLNVHEGPQNIRYKLRSLSESSAIVPGMITSDEPGIYIEGSHGIRTENELLCIEYLDNEWGRFYGFETLTLVPIDIEAIDKSMLNSDEINWLNNYHEKIYTKISPYLNDEEKAWLKRATSKL